MTIDELIAAMEKAEGPSRELDFWCWWWGKAVHGPFDLPDTDYVEMSIRRADSPIYTRSLDAALTLVPEGFAANVTIAGKGGHGTSATVFGSEDRDSGYVSHRVPAIALCIAALKARRNE